MGTRQKITKDIALDRLRQICSRSEKSDSYVRAKLTEWGLNNKADEIVGLLCAEDFLNEERFATAFAKDKCKFQKWGKVKIRFQLNGMQVLDSIISKALNGIDTEEYFQMINEELNKKIKSIKYTDKYHMRQKLFQFGSQRGYETDVLNNILDDLLND